MKTLVFVALFLLTAIAGCSKDSSVEPKPDPDPVPPVQPGDISMVFASMPDSVQLGKTAEFTFTVKQKDQIEKLTMSIDTVGAFNMSIDGVAFSEVKTVTPDADNKVAFTPVKEGMCKITFTITGKNGKTAKKELSIKSYATATLLSISLTSDSVRLGETSHFTLSATQTGHTEAFKLLTELSGKGKLTINGAAFSSVKTLSPGVENKIEFKPSETGNNKITFTATDKFGKATKQDVAIKCFFPEVKIETGKVPEQIAVETSGEFTFKVSGMEEEYALSIDTVIPVFVLDLWDKVTGSTYVTRRGVRLTINGEPLTSVTSVKSGASNTFKFANPEVVGDYKITFTVTDKFGNATKKEVTIKAVSLKPVTITFYETDPWLELEIYDKTQFYKVLNERYTYNPLSSVFVGKEVNYIYSKERPKPGFPGEWTIPGRGITAYVAQEGGKDFFLPGRGISHDTNVSTLNPEWDNKEPVHKIVKQGFHCLEFLTGQEERVGITEYTLTIYDYWGKKTTSHITVNALSRTETMPSKGELR